MTHVEVQIASPSGLILRRVRVVLLSQAGDGLSQVVNGLYLPLLQGFLLGPHVHLPLLQLHVQLQDVLWGPGRAGSSCCGRCREDGGEPLAGYGLAHPRPAELGPPLGFDLLTALAQDLVHGLEELPVDAGRPEPLGPLAVLPVRGQHVSPLEVTLIGLHGDVRDL